MIRMEELEEIRRQLDSQFSRYVEDARAAGAFDHDAVGEAFLGSKGVSGNDAQMMSMVRSQRLFQELFKGVDADTAIDLETLTVQETKILACMMATWIDGLTFGLTI